jgi:hypothetical protein
VVFDCDPDARVDSERLRAAADRDEILHVLLDAAVGEAVLPRAGDDTDDEDPSVFAERCQRRCSSAVPRFALNAFGSRRSTCRIICRFFAAAAVAPKCARPASRRRRDR